MKPCYPVALVLLFAGSAVRAEPTATDEADLLKVLQDADAVFTAQIGEVKPISQTNSIPASIRGEITFKDVKALKGKGEGAKFGYTYREGTTKNLLLESKDKVIVAVRQKNVTAVVPATEANLALVKKAEEKK